MSRPTGGEAIVAALEAADVGVVFGIPGTHNLEIYRALPGSSMRHVTPRHEQGAGYAADGYARVSGEPAVCVTTSGPGLTNIVTAVATAHADSVPMLVIAPGMPRGTEGADLGLLHELRDQQGVMAAVVDHATRAQTMEEAVAAVHGSFSRFGSERPRPAYLEIPVDLLEEPWDGPVQPVSARALPPAPEESDVARACDVIAAARRPVIVAGGGSRAAGDEVRELAELLGAPVVTTVNGKGVVSEQNRLSLGAALRLEAAAELIEAADVVILIGTELADTDLWEKSIRPSGSVVRVDIDAGQLHKNVRADVPIAADSAAAVAALCDGLRTRELAAEDQGGQIATTRERLAAEARADGDVWRDLQTAVRAGVDGDVVVAGDSAMASYFGTIHHWPMGPRDRFIYPPGYATLGYGLPAAVGAKCARPDASTVVLVGDGGFMFTVQELVTAVENRLNLPLVVVNNGGYRAIRDQMVDRGMQPLGVDLTQPDFAALGRACGARGVTTEGLDELAEHVSTALAADVPTVIEVVLR